MCADEDAMYVVMLMREEEDREEKRKELKAKQATEGSE